jgi:hypothetical protein
VGQPTVVSVCVGYLHDDMVCRLFKGSLLDELSVVDRRCATAQGGTPVAA